MTRTLLAASCCALALTLPAQALDLKGMSEAERDAFRAEVRAYLLDNPEVIMEAVAVLEQREQQAQVQVDRDLVEINREALFNDGHSWVGGNPDGDITLVEFMDYRCGYCRKAFVDVEQLIELDGNIRLILKEYPVLGEQSERAARFAIATQQIAGQDAYKAVHDGLMTMSGPVNEVTMRRLAEPLGYDADAILAHMDSDDVTAVLDDNHALGRRMHITGTPALVMNDELLRGYVELDVMLQIVDGLRSQ